MQPAIYIINPFPHRQEEKMENRLLIDTTRKQNDLDDLYGIFFEDLNHAADGGLYAELIQNRSFEFDKIDNADYHALTAWECVEDDGTADFHIETADPVSGKNPHYLVIDIRQPGKNVGICNTGYNTGIPLKKGETYYFTCFAKRGNPEEELEVSLRSREGKTYTHAGFTVKTDWTKTELSLVSPVTDTCARLAVTIKGKSRAALDFISLFPADTYKGRRNGLRKDLAQLLEDMQPKFLRFPGGCLVHDGSLDPEDRNSMYRWKNTIGPLWERPARRNNWGYNQTLGLGFYEYIQLCEDIGARPIPVLPGGYDPHHQRIVPLEELEPWVADALDLIEFANGDARTTKWGSVRAALGHEAPFGMEYLAIGNEEVGAPFFERYPYFHKAIREKYPAIRIINTAGPFAAGGEYERGWKSARENRSDLVDEHYYMAPEWFLKNHRRYDTFSPEEPGVFLGEYASHGNSWGNALCEASYMTGLERNAGVVKLACYAPLFCNIDYTNWKPDMIWFDNHRSCATPNYYIQKLFMNYQGDYTLPLFADFADESEELCPRQDNISGELVFSAGQEDARIRYSGIKIRNDDTGETLRFPDVVIDKSRTESVIGHLDWTNVTITCRAREWEGSRGFRIIFGRNAEGGQLEWELGGWQNQDTCLVEYTKGQHSCLSQYLFRVEQNRDYELTLQFRGRNIRTFADGKAYHDITLQPVVIEPLYLSASMRKEDGSVILKMVNVSDKERLICVHLNGMEKASLYGTVISMGGCAPGEENSLEQPDRVIPKEQEFLTEGSPFTAKIPPRTVMVFCLKEKKNPVLKGLFADPDMAFHNGTYYLYPTTDGFPGWSGWQFHVFSSPDLHSWTDKGVIVDLKTGQVPWATGSAWAPAIAEKNGNWYFYFCGKRPDGKSCIGVAAAPHPEGPFTVKAIPLLTPEAVEAEGVSVSQVIDPSVFIEEDGTPYLLFGNGAPALVRLEETMTDICPGTMRPLEGLTDFREAVTVLKRGGLYHFTWSCDDTGSEDYHVNYGTSESLSGPVTCHYPVLEKRPAEGILGTGHHCILKEPGKDAYVAAYHRFALPLSDYPEGKGFHRETCIDSVEFEDNGRMKKIIPTL